LRAYEIVLLDGQKPSDRRAIAFVIRSGDASLDAYSVFSDLSAKKDREVRTRFDYWIDGGINDKYFHGWPNDPDNRHFFVFKWNEGRGHNRLYGFICNPRKSNPRFQACILASHLVKTQWSTDTRELALVNALRSDPTVRAQVEFMFSENGKVGKRWRN
jgi:hypothetical protein